MATDGGFLAVGLLEALHERGKAVERSAAVDLCARREHRRRADHLNQPKRSGDKEAESGRGIERSVSGRRALFTRGGREGGTELRTFEAIAMDLRERGGSACVCVCVSVCVCVCKCV